MSMFRLWHQGFLSLHLLFCFQQQQLAVALAAVAPAAAVTQVVAGLPLKQHLQQLLQSCTEQ